MADTIKQENVNQAKPEATKVEAAKADNKKEDKKDKKEKKQRRPFKVVMKTWSKGLAKEASRISWEKKHDVLKDFITVVILCVILGAIFFGIDAIIVTLQNIGK